ncbi:unnamed protein product, partial [Symbiodinium pilosum]
AAAEMQKLEAALAAAQAEQRKLEDALIHSQREARSDAVLISNLWAANRYLGLRSD